jgi:hypothetical protein
MQLGVEQDAGSNPPPILKTPSCTDACFPARSCIASCQGAKDTGLDPTFPDSELCHSTTHRRAKIFGFVSVLLPHRHPEPRNLKFYLYRRSKQRLRPGKGVAEEMAISLEVEVVLLDIGRSVLFSHSPPVLSRPRRMGGRPLPRIGHVYRTALISL